MFGFKPRAALMLGAEAFDELAEALADAGRESSVENDALIRIGRVDIARGPATRVEPSLADDAIARHRRRVLSAIPGR